MTTGTVYALLDPRDNSIRYCGATTTGLAARLASHACAPCNADMAAWFADLAVTEQRPAIEPLESVEGVGAMFIQERWWIAKLRADGCALLNKTDGGQGSNGAHHTDEWKRAASERMREHNPSTPEHIERLRQMKIGVPRSEETKARISASKKGTVASPEARARMSAAFKGRKYSAETVAKRSGKNHGMYRDDIKTETILETIAKHGGNKTRAAAELGLSTTFIHRRLKAQKTPNGSGLIK